MAIPLMVSAALPVFANIMAAAVLLLEPTTLGEKSWRGGEIERKAPLTPLPLSGIANGLIRVLSVMVIAPDCEPVAVGEKVTLIWQLASSPRLVPQVLVSAKLPLAMMLAIWMFTLLGLLTVMASGALVVPTPCEPKFSEPGANALKAALSRTEIPLLPLPGDVAAKSGAPSLLKSPSASVIAPLASA